MTVAVSIANKITADAIKQELDTGGFDWLKGLITGKVGNVNLFSGLNSAMTAISQNLVPLAMSICVLFFIIELVELGASEKMNMEMFMKFFIKLAVGILLINSTPKLIEFGNAVSIEASSAVDNFVSGKSNGSKSGDKSELKDNDQSSNSTIDTVAQDLAEENKDAGMFDRIFFWLFLKLGTIASFFVSLFIGTVLISRLFEITIKGSFMAIPMGFVTEEGTRQGALRYLKQYAALWLQGPAIMLCFALFKTIQLTALTLIAQNTPPVLKYLVFAGSTIMCGLGLLGACKGTKAICESALGV